MVVHRWYKRGDNVKNDKELTNNDVQTILNNTFLLYKNFGKSNLLKIIFDNMANNPANKTQEIIADCWAIYKEYENVYYDYDWAGLCDKIKSLPHKYDDDYADNKFCRDLVLEILDLLEERFKNSKKRKE